MSNAPNWHTSLHDACECVPGETEAGAARPKTFRILALLHQTQGRTYDAIAAYRLYLTLVPDDGEALHNLGLLYAAIGQTRAAREAFGLAAARLSPDDAERATNLGVGAFWREEVERAVELFERALALDPAYVPAHYHLGVTRLTQGRCAEAIARLFAVVAAVPDYPQAAANLGVAYLSCGEAARAIPIFAALTRRDPADATARKNLNLARSEAMTEESADPKDGGR